MEAIIIEAARGQGLWVLTTVLLVLAVIKYLKAKEDDFKAFQREQIQEQRSHFDAYKVDARRREDQLHENNKQLMQNLERFADTQERIVQHVESLAASHEQVASAVEILHTEQIDLKKKVETIIESKENETEREMNGSSIN